MNKSDHGFPLGACRARLGSRSLEHASQKFDRRRLVDLQSLVAATEAWLPSCMTEVRWSSFVAPGWGTSHVQSEDFAARLAPASKSFDAGCGRYCGRSGQSCCFQFRQGADLDAHARRLGRCGRHFTCGRIADQRPRFSSRHFPKRHLHHPRPCKFSGAARVNRSEQCIFKGGENSFDGFAWNAVL